MESSTDLCFGDSKMAAERCKTEQNGSEYSHTMVLSAAGSAVSNRERSTDGCR